VVLLLQVLSTNLYAAQKEVVVYTALDQIFTEPILQEFEKQYGIKVKPIYDIEAVKTTGLVNRLIAEKQNPRCDVFWNNEIIRTIVLKKKGVLAPYVSPAAADIPAQFKDKDGYWAGFAARARVFVVNTDLLKKEDYPSSLKDFTDPKWQGKAAMANPLFGTTATHVSALYVSMGKESSAAFFNNLIANKTKIVDGNSVVRDMVASGEVLWGLTDTDDVSVGIIGGLPIQTVLPDQNDMGTLLIPNTISLIAGGPHPEEGKLLIDFILSKEIETSLCQSESAQIPLREDVKVAEGRLSKNDISAMQVDFEEMAAVIEESTKTAQDIFNR
jgi:iron(III) transport system substrate-binding protein